MFIDVHEAEANKRNVGDRVVVETNARNGRDAVLLGFVWPLVAFVAVLVVANVSGQSECVAALFALGTLVVYYALLYAMRKSVGRRFSFRIVDEEQQTMTI